MTIKEYMENRRDLRGFRSIASFTGAVLRAAPSSPDICIMVITWCFSLA